MKCLNKFILALTMTAVSGQVMAADACQHKNEFTNYVNPWIGTGGHGHVFLGANVPFGVIQVSVHRAHPWMGLVFGLSHQRFGTGRFWSYPPEWYGYRRSG